MPYWVLAAHPSNYRVVDSVEEQKEETWRIGGSSVAAGDRVAIYKFKGREAVRGVIALGEVLTNPQETDFPEDYPYALPGMRRLPAARAPGVRVRYVHPPGLPLWLGEHPGSVVDELSVTRAQGRTAFRITDDQWERLLQEVGGWPRETAPGLDADVIAAVNSLVRGRGGQGFGLTVAERRAVELHAVARAEEHFRADGLTVVNVSSNSSYDLHCTRGKRERRVEVKGTTGAGDMVLLTRNEVIAAKADPARAMLIVVHSILLARGPDGSPSASGGELHPLQPWDPAATDLTTLVYRYEVPSG